jgi:hypothetical protein
VTRLLAHAITRRAASGPDVGLRGQPLEQIAGGELELWATRWDAEPSLSRDDAFAHHDLVVALCDAGACLPIRFGTWLADEAAGRGSLESEQERFTAAVDRLEDRREVAVTLLWQPDEALEAAPADGGGPAPGPTARGPGRDFLEGRRAAHVAIEERRREAEALARRLVGELAVEQGNVRHETCPSSEVALSMSLLARKDEADALKARAMTAVAALSGVRGVVSGPWPPYTFTEELGGGGGG